MKKYKTYISIEEMLKARTDNDMLAEIMERCRPYITYIADIMYRVYDSHHDRSVGREDLYSFCSIDIMTAIRDYFHPERYDKKKDKHGYYKNGFTFVCQVAKRLLKHSWRYYRRKKRIPLDFIDSLDFITTDTSENCALTLEDMVEHADVVINDTIVSDKILSHYKKHNKKVGNSTLYTLVYNLINGDVSNKEMAVLCGITDKEMKRVVKAEIVKVLKEVKL